MSSEIQEPFPYNAHSFAHYETKIEYERKQTRPNWFLCLRQSMPKHARIKSVP